MEEERQQQSRRIRKKRGERERTTYYVKYSVRSYLSDNLIPYKDVVVVVVTVLKAKMYICKCLQPEWLQSSV